MRTRLQRFARPMKSAAVVFTVLLATSVLAQTPPVRADLPDGTTLAVRLEQDVKVSKVRRGDPVRAKLLAPVMHKGKVVIPRGADICGQVVTAERLGPARASRLAICFLEAKWQHGSVALQAYMVRHLALRTTVHRLGDDPVCPTSRSLGEEQIGSDAGNVPQPPPAPQNAPLPPPPSTGQQTPRRQALLELCSDRMVASHEKITFTSPPLAGMELHQLSDATGATELASHHKDVNLAQGMMMELRHHTP